MLFYRTDNSNAAPYRINVSDLKRAARLINPSGVDGEKDTVRIELKDGTFHEFTTPDTNSAIEWISELRSLGSKRAAQGDTNNTDTTATAIETAGTAGTTGAKGIAGATGTDIEVVEGTEDVSKTRARTNSMLVSNSIANAVPQIVVCNYHCALY